MQNGKSKSQDGFSEDHLIGVVSFGDLDRLVHVMRGMGYTTEIAKPAPSKTRGQQVDRTRTYVKFVRSDSSNGKKA